MIGQHRYGVDGDNPWGGVSPIIQCGVFGGLVYCCVVPSKVIHLETSIQSYDGCDLLPSIIQNLLGFVGHHSPYPGTGTCLRSLLSDQSWDGPQIQEGGSGCKLMLLV